MFAIRFSELQAEAANFVSKLLKNYINEEEKQTANWHRRLGIILIEMTARGSVKIAIMRLVRD